MASGEGKKRFLCEGGGLHDALLCLGLSAWMLGIATPRKSS